MKLLLDTHVWLWTRVEPERLGVHAREVLTHPDNELWLSPISVWEVLMLIEKGRVIVDSPAREWIERALRTVPMRACAVTNEVALRSRTLAVEHEDPADRFLAATALVYDLILVTADERLLRASGVPTLQA